MLNTAMEELCAARWSLFQDSDGRILDEYSVRKITFQKGISPDIRGELWLFLLGYYSFTSTSEERKTTDLEKRVGYDSLFATWNTTSFSPSDSFENYAKVIEKDSLRTDRDLDFFSDENIENVSTLERILKTFLILHPEFGYIQGMSDILAPLIMVLSSEHQAFWCFDHVMKTMGAVFSDLTLSEPLANLATLCHYIDKPLCDHLNKLCEGEVWLFPYRWILLKFKRELSFEYICRLWECFWSKHASDNFPLLFTAAVLSQFRDELLVCSTNEELLQFSQSLNGRIPLPAVLSLAQSIFERLKSDDYCPHDIKSLLSNESYAPPPLVGFVRTRQKFTTLHSNKIEVQRHQIWRALFGDTPVQSITSPFMLSPTNTLHSVAGTDSHSGTTACSKCNHCSKWFRWEKDVNKLDTHVGGRVSTNGAERAKLCTSPLPINAPPKMGFVPREREIQFRDDIRKTVHVASDGDSGFLIKEQPDDFTTTTHYTHTIANYGSCRGDVDMERAMDGHHLHNGYSTATLGTSNAVFMVNERVTSSDTMSCTGSTTTTCALANGRPCDSRGCTCACSYVSQSVDGDLQFDELRSEAQLTYHI